MRITAPLHRHDGWLLLAATVYLYVSLFATPSTPYHLGGDQVFFWLDGLRLLHGEAVYRDFFQFTPPGTDLVYFAAFRLFGARLWVPNLVVLLLGVALCCVCLKIARQIMVRPRAALALALYLVLVIGLTLDGTHHWFSLLLVMMAAATLLRGETLARIAVAGSLLGTAAFFTQTRGPAAAAAVAVWLMWPHAGAPAHWRARLGRVACLFAAVVAAWAVLSSHTILTLGLDRLWFFQAAYVHEYKVSGWNAPSIGFPDHLSKGLVLYLPRWAFAYLLLPVVLALSLWRCSRMSRQGAPEHVRRVVLLVLVGAALFAEVAASPSWFRFFCVSLPAVILLPWLMGCLGRYETWAVRAAWVGVASLACLQILYAHRTYTAVAELPAGRVATTPQAAEKWLWLAARTQPGEYLLQAEWPGAYLPLAVRNPLYLDVVASEGAADLGYLGRAMRELDARRVRYVVESPAFAVAEFHEYLQARYRRVHVFADGDEVWERKPDDDARRAPIGAPRS